MSNLESKTTEWKSLSLSRETINFAGAVRATLEISGDCFLSLTFKLKDGRTCRIRKNDYSVVVEAPVIPTKTKYLVQTPHGLSAQFDTKEAANAAAIGIEAEIKEVVIPLEQAADDLPF